jgi:hypothetical protein
LIDFASASHHFLARSTHKSTPRQRASILNSIFNAAIPAKTKIPPRSRENKAQKADYELNPLETSHPST